jgi:hypothetical protein
LQIPVQQELSLEGVVAAFVLLERRHLSGTVVVVPQPPASGPRLPSTQESLLAYRDAQCHASARRPSRCAVALVT